MTSGDDRGREDDNKSRCSDSLRGCCCCICLAVFLLLLLIVASTLLLILFVKPKKPTFDLESVSLQNISPIPDPSSSAQFQQAARFSLSIALTFTATNQNKVGIKYQTSTFKVMYQGFPLGTAFLSGFSQPANSVRRITAKMYVDTATIGEPISHDLKVDASEKDQVQLSVLGDIHARISVIGIDSPLIQVSVDCIIVISPKEQSVNYKRCGFDGLNV